MSAETHVGLSIGEVSRRTGQTVVALRHWEAIGLLPPPSRAGGKRRYPEEALSHIAMIGLVRRAGFSLEETRELLGARTSGDPPGGEWQALVARKGAELDERLAAVRAARRLLNHLADCRCRTFAECLTRDRRARQASPVHSPDMIPNEGRGAPRPYVNTLSGSRLSRYSGIDVIGGRSQSPISRTSRKKRSLP